MSSRMNSQEKLPARNAKVMNRFDLTSRLVDQSLSATAPTLIGVRIDDKPGVGATRRDPVQIRERFMLGLGVRQAL